jgi:hypothetical protein
MKPNEVETIFLVSKDAYQSLKWLQQHTDNGDIRPQYSHVYILGASLVASDGFSLGRIDIPEAMKEYCKNKVAFDLIKLTTSPYLAIVEEVRDYPKGYKPKTKGATYPVKAQGEKLGGFIEKHKDLSDLSNHRTSLSKKIIKTITTMPGLNERVDFYIKGDTEPVLCVSQQGYSILMPMYKEKPIPPDAKIGLSEEGKKLVEEVEEQFGGKKAPAQNIEEKDTPESE